MFRFLVLLVAILICTALPTPLSSQEAKSAVSGHQNAVGSTQNGSATPPSSSALPGALDVAGDQNGLGPNEKATLREDHPEPRITIANPPPQPASWPLRDRISWGANLLLAFVGYAGIMLALTTLRKIERQTRSGETMAQAAMESANAALLHTQAILDAERPWILISVEPSPQGQNTFKIIATNRGRSPAEIIASADRIGIAAEERNLPKSPEFTKEKPLNAPVVLLPGESTVVQPFSRDDVKWVCKTEDAIRRVETWQDNIFLYGRLVYRSLLSPRAGKVHQTDWCCRYVHGEKTSSLTIGGPEEYNKHLNRDSA
jgi:hypothetical protein